VTFPSKDAILVALAEAHIAEAKRKLDPVGRTEIVRAEFDALTDELVLSATSAADRAAPARWVSGRGST